MKRAVFLDRDGVINRYFCHPEFGTIDSPATPDEFVLCDGVREALRVMRERDFLLIVVSNQPGVAKARFTTALLDAVTDKMKRECGYLLNAVYYCLHHPEAQLPHYRQICSCRKPKPGLLLQAAQEWDVNLEDSYMIGDGTVDIEAGKAANVSTVLIARRKCYICHDLEQRGVAPDFFAHDINAAAEIVRASSANHRTSKSHVPCL